MFLFFKKKIGRKIENRRLTIAKDFTAFLFDDILDARIKEDACCLLSCSVSSLDLRWRPTWRSYI